MRRPTSPAPRIGTSATPWVADIRYRSGGVTRWHPYSSVWPVAVRRGSLGNLLHVRAGDVDAGNIGAASQYFLRIADVLFSRPCFRHWQPVAGHVMAFGVFHSPHLD